MPKEKDLHPGLRKAKKTEKGKKVPGLSLSLYVNKRNGEMTVNLIDNKSLEVIKEIPSQELLDIKDRIDEMADILVFNPPKSPFNKGGKRGISSR